MLERFPEVAFALHVTPFKPCTLIEEPPLPELLNLRLEGVEVLYIVGILQGASFELFWGWLRKDPKRRVLFWEEDLAKIDASVRAPWAKRVLTSSQVHLHYASDRRQDKESLLELACRFPTKRVEVVGGDEPFRLEVLKLHMAAEAHLQEARYGYKLARQALLNARRLPRAFDVSKWQGAFQGVAAIICGAGPSLSASIGSLGAHQERALLIAGGAASRALTYAGVEPHVSVAMDPNVEQARALEGVDLKRAPLLFSHRLHPQVFEKIHTPLGFVRTEASGAFERWLERELGLIGPPLVLGEDAFSVTTLNLSLAHFLGCNPLILVGVDLAYTENKRYASGIGAWDEAHKEPILLRRDLQGNEVRTLVKWVVEASAIGAFAKGHPEVKLINATASGQSIPSVPHIPLDEAMQMAYRMNADFCNQTPDPIARRVEALLLSTPFATTAQKVELAGQKVQRSLVSAKNLLGKMRLALQEGSEGLFAVHESDLQEELVYELLLRDLEVFASGDQKKQIELFEEALLAL